MKANDFELRLHRNLALAERAAGPLEITSCDCHGAFGEKTSCHIAIRGPEHLAKVVAALTRAGVTGIDRMGFDPDGRFLHVDIEIGRGRRRAWLIGNCHPEGADKIFANDGERFRALLRESRRRGGNVKSLVISTSFFGADEVFIKPCTSAEPDPAFQRRQARQAAASARLRAIQEFAATKGLSLAEATQLLDGKAA